MELANQVHELGRAPQLGQNHSKGLSFDNIKDFRQVYEDGNEVHILLMHFSCTWRTEKIMSVVLRFGRNPHWASGRFSSEMLMMRQLRMSQDFPSSGQERDAPVIAVVSLTAPVLEYGDECGIPEFFGHILFFPDASEE